MKQSEHVLVVLMEECAEIQKDVAKALRFGMDDSYPGSDVTNEMRINEELNDLLGTLILLEEMGIFTFEPDEEKARAKAAKVRHYIEYAKERGTVEVLDT